MKKLPKVSVGIPAYNEEANIQNLLKNILSQKQVGLKLEEIIVVSDASTDNTIKKIKELGNKKVKVIENNQRLGQPLSSNKILRAFKGDYLVLLNADVLPKTNLFLKQIIKPLTQDKKVGLVGGKVVPLRANNFLENILSKSSEIKQEMYENINSSDNIFLCHGRVRAFSKAFAKEMRWINIASEDAYCYLACVTKGFKFYYEPKAQVYYRSPQTFTDHFRQSSRFTQSIKSLSKHFDKHLVKTSYQIPLALIFKHSTKFLIKYPSYALSYLIILAVSYIYSFTMEATDSKWSTSQTTKVLVK